MKGRVPEGWVIKRLDSVVTLIAGSGFPKEHQGKTGHEYPFFKVGNLGEVASGELLRQSDHTVSEEVAGYLGATIIPPLSVVFAKIGAAIRLNRRRQVAVQCCIDNNMMAAVPGPALDPRYLLRWFETVDLWEFARATTVPSLRKGDIEQLRLPVPPLIEQRAIVAKIEALLSELDKGVEQLHTVKQQLKLYRQAVLKAGFEGKLTAEWREEQQAAGKLPNAKELLEQIKKEREERYQQQLQEWEQSVREWEEGGGKGSGKFKPVKPKQPPKLPTVSEPKTTSKPDLPQGWTWVRCGELLYSFRSGSTVVPQDDRSDLPILRSSSVRPGRVDLTDVRYIPPRVDSTCNDLLADGDVLFTRLSGTVDYVGVCAVVPGLHGKRIAFPDRIFCGKLVRPELAGYITMAFAAPAIRSLLEAKAKSSAGHMRVSMGDILHQAIPLPPLDELLELEQLVDQHLSVVDKLEMMVDQELSRAEVLRQGILRKAFEGRLLTEDERATVQSDPAYEPADRLLGRTGAGARPAGEATQN